MDYRKAQRTITEQNRQILELLSKPGGAGQPAAPAAPPPKSEPTTSAPTAAASTMHADPNVAIVLARQEFDDALEEMNLDLPKPSKKALRDMYIAIRPNDRATWITAQIDAFGLNKPAPAVTIPQTVTRQAHVPIIAPVTPPAPATDTGPPAGKAPVIPTHPAALPADVLANMTPEQIHDHYARFKRESGAGGHPLADLRARREAARRS